MSGTVDHLTRQAADRLHATHGTSGMPQHAGYFTHGTRLYAQWSDGSLAVAHYSAGDIVGWKPLPAPDYMGLFTRTESRETMPDAPKAVWQVGRAAWACYCGASIHHAMEMDCVHCGARRPADDA